MKGYTLGADAEDIVIISNTEGLSLNGGYLQTKDQPYAYCLGTDVNEKGEPQALATSPLEAGKVYVLMLRVDVDAGYDVSGLTKDAVILNI